MILAMSVLTSSIDLDMIEPPLPSMAAQFNASELEYFAKLLLKSGDTVRPIILSKISPISFRILEGYFEYYAALKAQEMNEQFTAIRAYVAPKEIESSLLEQYQFLRDRHSQDQPVSRDNHDKHPTHTITFDESSLRKIVGQLEVSLNQTLKSLSTDLSTKIARLDQRITELSNTVSTSTIQANHSQTKHLKTEVSKNKKTIDIAIDITKANKILEDMNTMSVHELQVQIAKSKPRVSIVSNFAEAIHKERQTSFYTSIDDVYSRAKVKGLAEATFKKITNAW